MPKFPCNRTPNAGGPLRIVCPMRVDSRSRQIEDGVQDGAARSAGKLVEGAVRAQIVECPFQDIESLFLEAWWSAEAIGTR